MTDKERFKLQFETVKKNDVPAGCFVKAWEAQQEEIDRLRSELQDKEVRITELLNERDIAFTPDKWRSPDERPKESKGPFIYTGNYGVDVTDHYRFTDNFLDWSSFVKSMEVLGWAYTSDLPKPEGL